MLPLRPVMLALRPSRPSEPPACFNGIFVDERDSPALREGFHQARQLANGGERTSPMIPAVRAKLLEGKRGLIVGIANENSIAWCCAKAFPAFGAELDV